MGGPCLSSKLQWSLVCRLTMVFRTLDEGGEAMQAQKSAFNRQRDFVTGWLLTVFERTDIFRSSKLGDSTEKPRQS